MNFWISAKADSKKFSKTNKAAKWGRDKYFAEVNEGKGLKLAKWLRPYLSYVHQIVVIIVFIVSVF